jgi:hypothetical protein
MADAFVGYCDTNVINIIKFHAHDFVPLQMLAPCAGSDMLHWKPGQQISSYVPYNKAQQLQFHLLTANDNMKPKGAVGSPSVTIPRHPHSCIGSC